MENVDSLDTFKEDFVKYITYKSKYLNKRKLKSRIKKFFYTNTNIFSTKVTYRDQKVIVDIVIKHPTKSMETLVHVINESLRT